jgi:hypothetical protein
MVLLMNKVNDTPYDIIDLPHVPYVPGMLEWCLLALGILVTVLLYRIFTQQRSKKVPIRRTLEKELEQLNRKNLEERKKLATLSLLLRRSLTMDEHHLSLASMSLSELELCHKDPRFDLWKPLIEILIEIERVRFQPTPPVSTQEFIQALTTHLPLLDQSAPTVRTAKKGQNSEVANVTGAVSR